MIDADFINKTRRFTLTRMKGHLSVVGKKRIDFK